MTLGRPESLAPNRYLISSLGVLCTVSTYHRQRPLQEEGHPNPSPAFHAPARILDPRDIVLDPGLIPYLPQSPSKEPIRSISQAPRRNQSPRPGSAPR